MLGDIARWLDMASTYADRSSYFFRSTLRSVEKLANADAFLSAVAQSQLHHLAGDLDEALHWVRNVRRFPQDPMVADDTEAIVLSNLGYFARARATFASVPAAPGRLENILLLCGGFHLFLERCGGTRIAELPDGDELIQTARRCSMALDRMNVSEARLHDILEVAGEVLRQHRLFFADSTQPLVRTNDDGMLYQLRVRVSPEDAAQYTHEVVEKMVERELDVDGLYFSFVPV
ncbi:MAG: hypothetical protein ACTHL8_18955 [Burkholderiaceae bacterium]